MNAFTTSTAVMARRLEPADSLDFFPTPPWATRALMQNVLPRFEPPSPSDGQFAVNAIDPACGEGHMAPALRERMAMVTAIGVFPYGFGGVADFLHPDQTYAPRDWIITNPVPVRLVKVQVHGATLEITSGAEDLAGLERIGKIVVERLKCIARRLIVVASSSVFSPGA